MNASGMGMAQTGLIARHAHHSCRGLPVHAIRHLGSLVVCGCFRTEARLLLMLLCVQRQLLTTRQGAELYVRNPSLVFNLTPGRAAAH
jgi:hypothetical protein